VSVNTTLVTVPVSVKDRRGKIVAHLERKDFRLYEDGVEQEIVYFDAPQEPGDANSVSAAKPFTVALLLDVSDSTQFKLEQIQTAAISSTCCAPMIASSSSRSTIGCEC